ncbi:unnamed protein product [Lupinus luteus]|uniref:Uncharacterized protein n=1 Tax=Lupinus luteus TaxID=3873 RepID=A0AAV1X0L7_LUPLU
MYLFMLGSGPKHIEGFIVIMLPWDIVPAQVQPEYGIGSPWINPTETERENIKASRPNIITSAGNHGRSIHHPHKVLTPRIRSRTEEEKPSPPPHAVRAR